MRESSKRRPIALILNMSIVIADVSSSRVIAFPCVDREVNETEVIWCNTSSSRSKLTGPRLTQQLSLKSAQISSGTFLHTFTRKCVDGSVISFIILHQCDQSLSLITKRYSAKTIIIKNCLFSYIVN